MRAPSQNGRELVVPDIADFFKKWSANRTASTQVNLAQESEH